MTITINEKGIRILEPEDGKYLTNGATYSQKVYLSKNGSPDDWREVETIECIPDPDPELTTEEALSIIMGGDIYA